MFEYFDIDLTKASFEWDEEKDRIPPFCSSSYGVSTIGLQTIRNQNGFPYEL